MKLNLANTENSCAQLIGKLEAATEIGFDTESAGPLLRHRKWKEGKTFINVHRSTMIGFSIAFPPPETPPKSWLKKNGELKAGKVLEPEAWYVPIYHNKGNADFRAVKHTLRLVESRDIVWGHNVKHDSKTLALAGYEFPRNWYDTYLASALVEPERESHGLKFLADMILGRESPEFDPALYNMTGKEALEYTCHDAVNTLELGRHFRTQLENMNLWDFFTKVESPFAVVLGEMERHGLGVNFKKLRKLSAKCGKLMDEIAEEWSDLFPDIDIGSSAQLQELFREGTWVPHGTTPGGGHSTDQGAIKHQLSVCEEGSAGHRAASLRMEHQTASKVATTYTLGYIEEALQFPDGRLHGDYRQLGARTGRLSSANPNLQNVPVRSALGKEVKSAFEPAPGYVFLSADYSQIELRVLAHLCGGKLAEAYKNNEDVHQQTASLIDIDRDAGKKLNFSVVYGAGPYLLSQQLGVSKQEAARLQKALFEAYPEIEIVMSKLVAQADSRGANPYIKTLTGRRIYVPQLLSVDPKERAAGVRKCGNAPIQGSAFDIMKIGMVNVRNRFLAGAVEGVMWNEHIKCCNNLHDEVTYEVIDDEHGGIVEACSMVVQHELENAFKLRVPLVAEPKVGRNWLETK